MSLGRLQCVTADCYGEAHLSAFVAILCMLGVRVYTYIFDELRTIRLLSLLPVCLCFLNFHLTSSA